MSPIFRRLALPLALLLLLLFVVAPITTQALPASCGEPATYIHDVQGPGDASPLEGEIVTIEGVVIADYQGSDQLRGYFVQEEDADADGNPSTSEGIFVFDPSHDVEHLQLARVTATVDEYFGLTELTGVSTVLDCGGEYQPGYMEVPFPHTDEQLEQLEGMLVYLPSGLTVTELYNLGRGGEFTLTSEGRLYQPTHLTSPGENANLQQASNDQRRLIVDDGSQAQNPDTIIHPYPHLSQSNRMRVGDATTTEVFGVLTYGWSGWYGSDNAFRVHPFNEIEFESRNPRSAGVELPDGHLTVASFNVLNYFNGDGEGGGYPTSRGADTADEFVRQRAKLINAIATLDSDILGLMEIENDGYGPTSAIQDLVNGLNDLVGPGAYAFVDPGLDQIGSDEIAVGIIYKPGVVTPVSDAAILDSSVDPTFIDTKNRPVLAQTFEENASGERFTVAVNHLKSKGSDCDALGDPDTGDGQGNCNLTRTSAAVAETNWLATDPTGSGDPDFLVIGDLNSYRYEDPVAAIVDGGYTDLIARFVGDEGYSYGFKGQHGYLDHALASETLAPQVTGLATWHINTDEPSAFDYNDYNLPDLYAPGPYRASDHDPSVVSLRLRPEHPLLPAADPRTY